MTIEQIAETICVYKQRVESWAAECAECKGKEFSQIGKKIAEAKLLKEPAHFTMKETFFIVMAGAFVNAREHRNQIKKEKKMSKKQNGIGHLVRIFKDTGYEIQSIESGFYDSQGVKNEAIRMIIAPLEEPKITSKSIVD